MDTRVGSTQRMIATQHRRIDSMIAEVQGALREGEPPARVAEAFDRVRRAIESHMADEDRLYRPALPDLRPDRRAALRASLEAHPWLADWMAGIAQRLAANDVTGLADELAALAHACDAHEAAEERVLGDIENAVREVLAQAS
jgi:hypothetical protein